MYSFERLKEVLKKREQERYEALKEEIRILKSKIEKLLDMFFESTTSKAQTNFVELQMY